MKKSILTVLILGGAFMLLPDTAKAQTAYDYGWCALYSGQSGGVSNCYFRTHAQCMDTARGAGAVCQPNPFYNAAHYQERPRTQRRIREY